MRSRRTKERREMSHYIVGLVAVLAGLTLYAIGQDSRWAWVTGWAVTSAAVFGGGLIYLLKISNRHIFRGQQLSLGIDVSERRMWESRVD